MKTKSYLSMACFILFCFSVGAFGRDFAASVSTLSSYMKGLIAVLGPLAVLITGAVFYFSRHIGMNFLVSAILGTIIAAASSTIFSFFYNAFQ